MHVQLGANGGPITIADNDSGGDVPVWDSTGPSAIDDTVIGRNLPCQGNAPAPTGAGNVVGGSAEEPCAGFALRR